MLPRSWTITFVTSDGRQSFCSSVVTIRTRCYTFIFKNFRCFFIRFSFNEALFASVLQNSIPSLPFSTPNNLNKYTVASNSSQYNTKSYALPKNVRLAHFVCTFRAMTIKHATFLLSPWHQNLIELFLSVYEQKISQSSFFRLITIFLVHSSSSNKTHVSLFTAI